MAARVLLVDGNSLIHRAYHALPPLTTSAGQPTNAAFGFTQMLLLLLQQESPDVAVLAMDASGPTFRHEMDPQYKANREEMDEDLASQFDVIRELSEAMGLTVTELPGHEADDIIGTLARNAADQGEEVLVVSGDRDMVQLVEPGVQVLATLKGIKDTRVYDQETAREEYGVDPPALADLKGLAGDTSDNIPGVPGVGPKTAAQLLSQFGTVDNLYANLDQVDKASLRQRLADNEAAARLSVELARIDRAAPVEPGLLERPWPGVDVPRLRRLLARLEFTSLLGRLPGEPPGEGPEAVTEPAEVEQVCSEAREAGLAGLAVAWQDDAVAGLALCAGGARVAYLPVTPPAADTGLFAGAADEALPACVVELLQDDALGKVGHDLKGLARGLDALDVTAQGFRFDTDVAAYLVAPHRGDVGLDALVAEHLGEALPAADEVRTSDLPAGGARAVSEAAVVLRLQEPLEQRLAAAGALDLFRDMEMPLVGILRDMEAAGIAVDRDRLEEAGDKLEGLMLAERQRVHQLAGAEFNVDSPKQVAEVLFGRLELPKGRKTKTGWSTSAEVLEELAVDHEVAARILQYREYAKLKSTYVDALMRLVSPRDGRVHTTFEQTVVATGRLSSRNPNLQNIPIRTEWGREIRSCFVAGTPGTSLLAADYSQIELRILAHMSRDESLLEAFSQGLDIHSATAAAIFDVDLQDVAPDMRRVAKTVNYAVIYGMGAVALARQLGIKRPEARQFIDSYFERLPGVKRYMEQVVATARETGYVQTLMGRRRPVSDLLSGDQRTVSYGERAAANAPLQGTAADIIKVAMVRLADLLPSAHPQCRMLLQVHDELVFELPTTEVPSAAPVIKEVMEDAAQLDVPLVVDVKVGANWRDMERF